MGKADAGDAIIGGVLLVLGLLAVAGALGVPFLDWISEILFVAVGILMVRGDLGVHPRIGTLLIVLGPVIFLVSGFALGLSMTLLLAAGIGLVFLVVLKFLGVW